MVLFESIWKSWRHELLSTIVEGTVLAMNSKWRVFSFYRG